MKKLVYVIVIVILCFCILYISGCKSEKHQAEFQYISLTIPPTNSDSDGDTVPDSMDCAPNDKLRWEIKSFWPDKDGDGIPDSAHSTSICVGKKETNPSNWTTTPPPPLDGHPYMQIVFAFAKEHAQWQVFGTCFEQPNPTDAFPQMGYGGGSDKKGIVIGTINPDAVSTGSCFFAINFPPPVQNDCGLTNWMPCQNRRGENFGFGKNGSIMASYTRTGKETDLKALPIIIVENHQGGANFRVNLKSLQ
ncbi:MAG: hypothetical protein A2Y67_02730 [Candidatus Buchananbacteria bacterium RBG_13_39_9]|uniref:Uncharacterized protein n=1 Tax=Candidatus Buchananbacteria bacterium RBG_13_39_9 TaxID=1797531 RepID=A0A1G1XN05_9BACT|nr:MAG: hypothetical protein A2Y67_02730 [Candidatus Buchananbacteria bacterium RBG_13_39_9]